jgi:spermidine synthase
VAEERLPEVNGRVLDDPRVRVRLVDGRNHVLGTSATYDCILSDSVHPRYRGNASLYTVEYFRACRERLAPGGLVSTWLPIYGLSADSLSSILRCLREVFPATSVWYVNSTVNEFVIVVGRTEEGPLPVERMRASLAVPSVRESLARIGVDSVEDLLDFYVAEGAELDALIGSAPLHHDDRPWVELESAAVLDRDGSWLSNLRRVVGARHPVGPHLPSGAEALAAAMERRQAATTEQLAGQILILEKAPPELWRPAFRRARTLEPDDREPWEVHGAPPWVARLSGAREAPP